MADGSVSTRLEEEKEALMKKCEETVSLKLEEAGQLRLQLEAAREEVALSKNQVGFFKNGLCLRLRQETFNLTPRLQVTSVNQCLKLQEKLGAELQKQVTKLSDSEEELKKVNESQAEELRRFQDELNGVRRRLEAEQELLRDAEAQVSSLEEQKTKLETAAQEAEVKKTLTS